MLHLATDRACEVLRSDGSIVLLSVDGDGLEPAGARVRWATSTPSWPTRVCRAAPRCAPVPSCSSAPSGHEEFPVYAPLAMAAGICRVLSVPLRHGDQLVGTLSMVRLSAIDYAPDEIDAAPASPT
jgi:hypothetical protein